MKLLLVTVIAAMLFASCGQIHQKSAEDKKPVTSSVTLPYSASFSSQFNNDVADEDVRTVLNSYKSWEAGNMDSLAACFADSVIYLSYSGLQYTGPKKGMIELWTGFRDSLRSVKIEVTTWTKNHSIDKGVDFVNVWYRETDTFKSGKVESFSISDANTLKNGKIFRYSQYRQEYKKW